MFQYQNMFMYYASGVGRLVLVTAFYADGRINNPNVARPSK